MPRYFFNVHDGRGIPDDTGTEFVDDTAAKTEAVRTSGELIRDFGRSGSWNDQDWAMSVTDHAGRQVAMLRFSGL